MVLLLKWPIIIYLSLMPLFLQAAPAADTTNIKFAKKSIKLEHKKISVEVAETDAQHEQGLMFRKKLGLNEGMIFIFKDEHIRNFWMKNTIINLSIGYFDKNKKLIDIQEMLATTSMLEENPPAYPSTGPTMYALEMNQGWYKKNNIKVGAHFKFEK